MKTFCSKRYNPKLLSALFISLYAIYLRSARLAGRDLWDDEIFQFNNIAGPLKPFWANVGYISGDHTTFPGEYVLTYPFVQWFGLNKWALAVPHIAVTILGFYFLYKLCSRYFTTTLGYVVAFVLVCFNVNLIFHSFEFRPYAVLPTLALGAFYFSDLIVAQYAQISRIKKMLIALFFVVGVSYHAYGIIIFALPAIYVIAMDGKGRLREVISKDFFKFFAGVFFSATLLWGWFASNNYFGVSPNKAQQSIVDPFQFIPNPLVNVIGFLKGVLGNLIGHKGLYVILIGMITAFLLPHKRRFHQFIFLLLLVVLPIGLIFLADIMSSYWFVQRQFVWVMPLFAFFLGWCCDSTILFLQNGCKKSF
jgi:hypothetical protein